MKPELTGDLSMQQAAARSGLYSCFALGYSYPTEDLVENLISGRFSRQIIELAEKLPYTQPFDIEEVTSLCEDTNPQDLKVFHSSYFQSGNQAVSLREVTYSSLTEKALIEELFRFYQHFGLQFAEGELREPADNIVVELEFLHYLSFLEASASTELNSDTNMAALRRAENDFIQLHPGKWLRPLLSRLESIHCEPFYMTLTELLIRFVSEEIDYLSESCDAVLARG